MAKEGNVELLESMKPTLNMHAATFANDAVYNNMEIDPLYVTTNVPGAPMTPDRAQFQTLTDEVMDNPIQVVGRAKPLRLGEDDLPTGLVTARNPERVLSSPTARSGQRHHAQLRAS